MGSAKKPVKLVVSLGYLPAVGGSYRVLHELLTRTQDVNWLVVTNVDHTAARFDEKQSFTIWRSLWVSLLNEDSALTQRLNVSDLYRAMLVRIIRKGFKYFVFPVIAFVFLIYVIVSRKVTTIVFAQSVLPFAWYIAALRRASSIKLVTFVYGEDVVGYRKRGWTIKVLRGMYATGLRNAHTIIANSESTKDEIVAEGIRSDKVVVVYPAVDYAMFTPIERARARLLFGISDEYVLLSVGRLIRRKGFDLVLDILPKIQQNIPNVSYIICGTGYDKQYLISKADANGVREKVRFLDNIMYQELPALYSASDLFVLPNRLDDRDNEQEGFGIVFLEANACGVPVIGGDSGGVREVIRQGVNGFLVDPRDSRELVEKILSVYQQKDVFRPEQLREYVQSKYTWDNSARIFRAIVERAVTPEFMQ